MKTLIFKIILLASECFVTRKILSIVTSILTLLSYFSIRIFSEATNRDCLLWQKNVTFSCEYFKTLDARPMIIFSGFVGTIIMSLQLELSEQSDTSIEEVPPKEEDRLLQEEPDEDVLKLKVDLNTSEKFEEQVDNLVPTNKNPLESLVMTSQKSRQTHSSI